MTNNVASWKPIKSYKQPAAEGPMNAPKENEEFQIDDSKA